MKWSELTSHEELSSERKKRDPAHAAEARSSALAGAISVAVVRYRVEHELTQTNLGKLLGWKQPQVARLERGDVTPSWETLDRLARARIIEVHLDKDGTSVHELTTA